MGIRQMGVITSANTMADGGSLSSSVGQSLKNFKWMSTNICSAWELGHGIRRQSDISSVQLLKLLYILQCGDREIVEMIQKLTNVYQYFKCYICKHRTHTTYPLTLPQLHQSVLFSDAIAFIKMVRHELTYRVERQSILGVSRNEWQMSQISGHLSVLFPQAAWTDQ